MLSWNYDEAPESKQDGPCMMLSSAKAALQLLPFKHCRCKTDRRCPSPL